MKRLGLLLIVLSSACGPPKAIKMDDLLGNLPAYLGKRIVVKGRFRSGARCKLDEQSGWVTYCKDCQYCRGPLVAESALTPKKEGLDDWPLILAGTWEGQDLRCKGPLNEVSCGPLEPGKLYVIRGRIERHRPPKLFVDKVWTLDEEPSSKPQADAQDRPTDI